MAKDSLLRKVDSALNLICHAFANIGEAKSTRRVCDPIRRPQSLRWSLPFMWLGLVYLSFVFGYSTVQHCVPAIADCDLAPAPMLICSSRTRSPGASPDHGDDPHGPDPHDELHDPTLPANEDPPDIFEKKEEKEDPR